MLREGGNQAAGARLDDPIVIEDKPTRRGVPHLSRLRPGGALVRRQAEINPAVSPAGALDRIEKRDFPARQTQEGNAHDVHQALIVHLQEG